MRTTRVWAGLLGLGAAVVEGVEFGEEGEVVVGVDPVGVVASGRWG